MNGIPQLPGSGSAPASADAKLKQVAKQFEAIFLQELFKGLEKPPDAEPGLFDDSQASRTFDQMHHEALANEAAGGMGIADLLYRSMLGKSAQKPPAAVAGPAPSADGQPPE